jgi:hypothetical protein
VLIGKNYFTMLLKMEDLIGRGISLICDTKLRKTFEAIKMVRTDTNQGLRMFNPRFSHVCTSGFSHTSVY